MELPDFIHGENQQSKATILGMDFQLPEDPGLPPQPSLVSLARLIARNRQLRALFPRGIRTAEERWRAKTNKEFCL